MHEATLLTAQAIRSGVFPFALDLVTRGQIEDFLAAHFRGQPRDLLQHAYKALRAAGAVHVAKPVNTPHGLEKANIWILRHASEYLPLGPGELYRRCLEQTRDVA